MANRTEKDAFERIVKAKMGSLAGKPTTEYLEALKNCPDEIVKFRDNPTSERNLQLLTTELGVYDNYPIFLNTDFNKVVEHLKKSKSGGSCCH